MAFQYQILADQIAQKIYNHELHPNQKLSSLRNFALNHRISMTTAKTCYELLEARGLIFVKPKSGYFVKAAQEYRNYPIYPEFGSHPRKVTNLELQNEIQQASVTSGCVHLGAIQLSPTLIPIETLRRSLQRALKHSAPEDFLYNERQGHPKLRHALSAHFAEDGIYIAPDLIFITSGCMPALSLAIRTLTQAGDSIIVPMPNYNGQQLLLANLERKIVEVPATHRGIDLQRLEQAMQNSGAKACLLTANYQNPLGFCLTNSEKEKIASLAAKYRCFIIEDDIYAECGHVLERPLPIQYWDKEGFVFLCSSISKSLSPAYRIGWFCLPPQRAMFREKVLSLIGRVNTPLQLGLSDFLQSRAYRRHLNQLKPQLAYQVQEYLQFIEKEFGYLGVKFIQPSGGYSLWMQLSPDIDGLVLYKFAQSQKINIVPGEVFGEDQRYSNFIRINLGYPLDEEICRALIILRDWMKAQLGESMNIP